MGVTPESASYFEELNPNIYGGATQFVSEVVPKTATEEATVMDALKSEIAEIKQRAAERDAQIRYVETDKS